MLRQRLSPLALAPLLLVIFAVYNRGENRTPAAQPPLSGAMATDTAPVQPAQTRVRDPHFRSLPGATADAGTFSGGVHWIEVPENWNGGLVLYAHGYRGDGPALVVSDPPIRQHLIAGGYTWGLPAVGFAQTPTEKGRALQSVGKYLMGGELPFWREGFAARMTQAANLLPLADPNRQVTPGGRASATPLTSSTAPCAASILLPAGAWRRIVPSSPR